MLQQLSRETQFDAASTPSPMLNKEEFVKKIKVWREATSTSPSGLHLGHYRSLVSRHEFSNKPDKNPMKKELDVIQAELIMFHLRLLNYALSRGYAYERWKHVVSAMLWKEEGNIQIHRTRVIHLFGADYNLSIGVKWKQVLLYAENNNWIHPGQYGSRPRRNAHHPVFVEALQLDISRVTRKPLIKTNYDAASCYNRIIPSVASLASRKYGVPDSVVKMNVEALKQAEYRLKTDIGISTQGYTHSVEHPIFGTGQGSGNSPFIWCMVSSVLFILLL